LNASGISLIIEYVGFTPMKAEIRGTSSNGLVGWSSCGLDGSVGNVIPGALPGAIVSNGPGMLGTYPMLFVGFVGSVSVGTLSGVVSGGSDPKSSGDGVNATGAGGAFMAGAAGGAMFIDTLPTDSLNWLP
jgi:hypothetical protein